MNRTTLHWRHNRSIQVSDFGYDFLKMIDSYFSDAEVLQLKSLPVPIIFPYEESRLRGLRDFLKTVDFNEMQSELDAFTSLTSKLFEVTIIIKLFIFIIICNLVFRMESLLRLIRHFFRLSI